MSKDWLFSAVLQAHSMNYTRDAETWDRMSKAGAQLMTWFGMACSKLIAVSHRDWRNDIEGLTRAEYHL